jgi:hypothetical protein
MSTGIDKKYIYICMALNSLMKYERRIIMKAIKRAYASSGIGVDENGVTVHEKLDELLTKWTDSE